MLHKLEIKNKEIKPKKTAFIFSPFFCKKTRLYNILQRHDKVEEHINLYQEKNQQIRQLKKTKRTSHPILKRQDSFTRKLICAPSKSHSKIFLEKA